MSEAMFNKDTQLCISLAAKPSNFGMIVHNAGYRALKLNYLYKAFGISDPAGALAGVRALGIRGCSISMPFKEQVVALLDAIDPAAASIGAVNTVVNTVGVLKGYNTDAYGAQVIIGKLGIPAIAPVLVLGAGGVARAILYALETLGFRSITLANRSIERFDTFEAAKKHRLVQWSERNTVPCSFLINCTSIGMPPDTDTAPVDLCMLDQCQAVMDVVVSPRDTRLIGAARAKGKSVVSGYQMSLHQAIRQFELYTGKQPPENVMEQAVKSYLHS